VRGVSSELLAGRVFVALAVAATLALLPGAAVASPFGVPTIDAPSAGGGEAEDPKVLEAKAEYRAGSDAYALGNYEEAVEHFERAYELSQEPALLFNLGQSYTRWYDISNNVDHLKKARRLYENYVLNVGATGLDEEGQAQARADAQRRIAEVDRRIAQHEEAQTSEGPIDGGGKKPVHKKAWFWLTIVGGAAVVGGVVAAVVVTTRPKPFEPELGTIGRAPLEGGGLTLRF
jgi:tetratricopeptide (TPR) repeat protein